MECFYVKQTEKSKVKFFCSAAGNVYILEVFKDFQLFGELLKDIKNYKILKNNFVVFDNTIYFNPINIPASQSTDIMNTKKPYTLTVSLTPKDYFMLEQQYKNYMKEVKSQWNKL